MKTYPLADRLPKKFEWTAADRRKGQRALKVRAVLTGEKRPPKRGEWYLSGAIPEAYRAPNDLDQPLHICVLRRVERVESWRILGEV